MSDDTDPKERLKLIQRTLKQFWLTPEERRQLENELLKLLKQVTTK